MAAGLALVMIGALKPQAGNGWMFSQPGGGWEYVAFLVVALIALVFTGGGAFGLDALRDRVPVRREVMTS